VSYHYDPEARLTNTSTGVVMVYDGDGNRRIRTVSGTTTWYVVDTRSLNGYAQVIEELTGFGVAPARLYTHGLDLISQRQSGGATHYYGYDGNGNVRYLTATDATVSDTYVYDAFGTVIASTGSTPNNYRYTGEQYDPNLGFYYLRARYLNPGTGRFWTRDTYAGSIYDPPSLHRYAYCLNDPVNGLDPSGHENIFSTVISIAISGSLEGSRNTALLATLAFVASAVCAAQAAYTTTANLVFNQDTTGFGGPCAFRSRSRNNIYYRYDPIPGKTLFPPGTYVTDNPSLSRSRATAITFFSDTELLYVYQLSPVDSN
jgi:RHS repeat-associated protein